MGVFRIIAIWLSFCFLAGPAMATTLACPALEFMGCPAGQVDMPGRDAAGCPTHKCVPNSARVPPACPQLAFLGCGKGEVDIPGKDGNGCPTHKCVPAAVKPPSTCPQMAFLGCPQGQVDFPGKDKNGCPTHSCRTVACPALGVPDCPADQALVKGLANGCPVYSCKPIHTGGGKCRLSAPVCAPPPAGCHYAQERDAYGCQVGCGHLVCDGTIGGCPEVQSICKDPPPGCAYLDDTNPQGCRVGCGHLGCTNTGGTGWAPEEPWGRCGLLTEMYCKDGKVKKVRFERGCPVFSCEYPPGAKVEINDNDGTGKPGTREGGGTTVK